MIREVPHAQCGEWPPYHTASSLARAISQGLGAPLPRPATRSPAEGKMAELVRYKGWPRVFLWLPFLVMDEVLGQFILGSVLKKAVAK